MTAPMCAPGTSQVKAGFDPVQILLGDAIGDVLVGLAMPELAAVFASVGVLQFGLSAVCAQDPPPLPTINAAKLLAYYDSQSKDAYPLILRDAQDLLGHYLWWQWCECIGAATPPPPSPTPLPPDVTIDNPAIRNPSGTPCAGGSQVFETKTLDANGDVSWDITGTSTFVTSAQWIQWTHNGGFNPSFPSGYPLTWNFDQVSAGGTLLQRTTWTQTADIVAAAKQTHQVSVAEAATTYKVSSHSTPGAAHPYGAELHFSQYCTAPPSSLLEPCCPPDPLLENLIIQVLRLEQLILQSLGGSTTYTRGTVHAHLTGSGSLSVAGLRGVAVSVTAGTPTVPLLPGVPPYQWDLGWLSVMTGDGMIEERRLTRQTQVWLPSSMPLATTFGYFLFPGVTADITELLPA